MPENILKTWLDVLTNAKKLFCQSIVRLFFLNIFEATNHLGSLTFADTGDKDVSKSGPTWAMCYKGSERGGHRALGHPNFWTIRALEVRRVSSKSPPIVRDQDKERLLWGTAENSVSPTRGHWFDLQSKQCFFPFGHQNIWLLATSLMCWAHYWIIGET